jgi:hypothetical protein
MRSTSGFRPGPKRDPMGRTVAVCPGLTEQEHYCLAALEAADRYRFDGMCHSRCSRRTARTYLAAFAAADHG